MVWEGVLCRVVVMLREAACPACRWPASLPPPAGQPLQQQLQQLQLLHRNSPPGLTSALTSAAVTVAACLHSRCSLACAGGSACGGGT